VRDLYESLSAPCADYPEICARLLTFFQEQNICAAESLPLKDNAVISALLDSVDQKEPGKLCLVNDLTLKANRHLQMSGERVRLSPHAVGRVLTQFGLNTRRPYKQRLGPRAGGGKHRGATQDCRALWDATRDP
jgi:hypothetical protein